MKKHGFTFALVALLVAIFASCSQLQLGGGGYGQTVKFDINAANLSREITIPTGSNYSYSCTITIVSNGKTHKVTEKFSSADALKNASFTFRNIKIGSTIDIYCKAMCNYGNGYELFAFGVEEGLAVENAQMNISLNMQEPLGAFTGEDIASVIADADKITELKIPYGYTSVAMYNTNERLTSLLMNYGNIKKIIIPDTVSSFDAVGTENKGAFQNCKNLVSIEIPDSVKIINANAFRNCQGLKSISIPDSVTYIGESVFNDCLALTSVKLPNIDSIYKNTFEGCTSLTSITIPNSVTFIGESAFSGCTNLEYVYALPKTPPELYDDGVFDDALKAIYVLPGLSDVDDGSGGFISCQAAYSDANYWPSSKIQVLLSKSELAKFAPDYKNATTIVIPAGNYYTVIASDAFSECANLTTLTIPDTISKIEAGAFKKCNKLNSVTVLHGMGYQSGSITFGQDSSSDTPEYNATVIKSNPDLEWNMCK